MPTIKVMSKTSLLLEVRKVGSSPRLAITRSFDIIKSKRHSTRSFESELHDGHWRRNQNWNFEDAIHKGPPSTSIIIVTVSLSLNLWRRALIELLTRVQDLGLFTDINRALTDGIESTHPAANDPRFMDENVLARRRK